MLAIVVLASLIYYIVLYNGLITRWNSALRALSGTVVQLKRRWDLIPRLVQ